MKINILQYTKRGVINSVINRSSLKNYIFFSKLQNKNIWIKPDYWILISPIISCSKMKINILQYTKRGVINSVINRSSLKNYIFFSKLQNKNIWIKPDYYQEIVSQLQTKTSKKLTATYRKEKGTTEFMKKKYIRFRFALWRYKLTEVERIKLLFKKLEKKYKSVKDQGKKFPTQRIGLTFTSQEKEFNTFTNSKTKRKNTVEVYDFISTATYANNDPSTIGMFDELLEKTLQYYMKTGSSPSMLDDDSIKTAKHFYVFFVEA